MNNLVFTDTTAGVQTITTGVNFNAGFSGGVVLTTNSTGGGINITMGGTVAEAVTLNVTSTGGAQTLVLGSGVGSTGAYIVNETSSGGAQNLSGAAVPAAAPAVNANVTATSTMTSGAQTVWLGDGADSITDTAIASGAQTITLGNGNDTINSKGTTAATAITLGNGTNSIIDGSAVVAAGPVAITVGTGANAMQLDAASTNTTGVYTVVTGVHTGLVDSYLIGTAGNGFAATANLQLNVNVAVGDVITFAADPLSSSVALTPMLGSTIAAIEAAAVLLGAHGVAYGYVGGNTYIAEEIAAGAASATNTTLVEIIGSATVTFTAAAGHVTVSHV
jgi:hypothetical protein